MKRATSSAAENQDVAALHKTPTGVGDLMQSRAVVCREIERLSSSAVPAAEKPCSPCRQSTTARYTHIDSERLAGSSETYGFTAVIFMRVRAARCNAARPGMRRMPSSWKKLR
jgi:hypothetical protein